MEHANPDPRTVARVLHDAIQDAGLSQRMVAEGTGIPLVTLSRRLTGSRALTVEEVCEIATLIGIRPSELLRRAEGLVAA